MSTAQPQRSAMSTIQALILDPTKRPTPAEVARIARLFGAPVADVQALIDRHQQPAPPVPWEHA